MNEPSKFNRRKFLRIGAAGAGLAAAGAVAGWSVRRLRSPAGAANPPLDARFRYDVSAFVHTAPALLRYTETGQIPTGFESPRCVSVGADDTLLVGGDRAVKRFAGNGQLLSTFQLPDQPQAVEPAGDGRLLVALKERLEIYDRAGARLVRGESLGAGTHLTALASSGETIFAADAGHREIVRCDRDGRPLARFGRIGANDGNPGFVVPSPYFDLMLGTDGLLWVANPGRHRVEAYTLDGRFELGWGQTSMSVEGFCGCCNPVYFTRRPDGRFITSEKGLNRIKVYDPQGALEGVVAGPEQLVKDLDLARKACANCSIGFGFDVACDSAGRVFALDPATRAVRVFTPKENAAV